MCAARCFPRRRCQVPANHCEQQPARDQRCNSSAAAAVRERQALLLDVSCKGRLRLHDVTHRNSCQAYCLKCRIPDGCTGAWLSACWDLRCQAQGCAPGCDYASQPCATPHLVPCSHSFSYKPLGSPTSDGVRAYGQDNAGLVIAVSIGTVFSVPAYLQPPNNKRSVACCIVGVRRTRFQHISGKQDEICSRPRYAGVPGHGGYCLEGHLRAR